MSDVNLATKSDLASLFQELEDAAKHAKIENKENKIKTESQVKELDSFLTSVQEVVKVIDETPKEEPKVVEVADIVVEQPVIETPVVETKSLSLEDEDKLGAFAGLMSSFGAILDAPPEVEDTDALKLQVEDTPKVVTQEEEDSKLEALQNLFSSLVEAPRIPRKKGQPAGSDKHSDLYTDENPKGTIQGLGFKDVATAKASVSKIEGSSKTHAHKIQAAVAMEQRAKEMGKKAEAAIYRKYIDEMKKKTKEMQKEDVTQREINDLERFADRILKKYGVDIEFTRHFVDRMNDTRNSPAIKVSELQKFFKKIQRNKATNIINNPDIEAVLKDMSTNLNLPVVIKKKGNEFEVTNKTIMRKPNFSTTSKVFKYESYEIGTDDYVQHTMKVTPGQPIQNFRKTTDKITDKDLQKFQNEGEIIDKYKKRFKENWKVELDKAVERMKEEL